MSYPKQAGFSPPFVEPSAPPCEQPVIVQQVFVVQQSGSQPVYVRDNMVKTDQPPPYSQHSLVQQPLVAKPALEQPQQPVPAVQRRRKRRNNGDPECMKNRTGYTVLLYCFCRNVQCQSVSVSPQMQSKG